MAVFVYAGLKWADYHQAQRDYDRCALRVDHANDDIRFHETLIRVLGRELPNRSDIVSELTAVLPGESDSSIQCPDEPTIFNSFKDLF